MVLLIWGVCENSKLIFRTQTTTLKIEFGENIKYSIDKTV